MPASALRTALRAIEIHPTMNSEYRTHPVEKSNHVFHFGIHDDDGGDEDDYDDAAAVPRRDSPSEIS